MAAHTKDFTVAIVGGGLTGLALAVGLSARGIGFRIYEAKSSFAEISAGISLSPNAIKAMERLDPRLLDTYAGLVTQNAAPDKKDVWFDFRLGQKSNGDGEAELVTTLRMPGVMAGNVHRGRFLSGMAKLLPADCAEFDKTLVGIKDRKGGMGGSNGSGGAVELQFADGSTAEADAVVACDGIRSAARKLVLGGDDDDARQSGGDPVFTDVYAYRGLVAMQDAVAAVGEDAARNSQVYMGRDGDVVTYPIDEGQTLNVVAFSKSSGRPWESEKWVAEVPGGRLMQDFAGWASPVKKLLEVPTP